MALLSEPDYPWLILSLFDLRAYIRSSARLQRSALFRPVARRIEKPWNSSRGFSVIIRSGPANGPSPGFSLPMAFRVVGREMKRMLGASRVPEVPGSPPNPHPMIKKPRGGSRRLLLR